MEEEESEISLVSDTVTQDTEMYEPPSNQEDFFVWIKNLDSYMENREQSFFYPNFSRVRN